MASLDQFRIDLEALLNRHSMENASNTPDFILADYLRGCLNLFDLTVKARSKWYGHPTLRESLGVEGQ